MNEEGSKKAESMIPDEDPNKALNEDMKKSFDRVEELRRGRTQGDIPLDDPYWLALKNHRFYHGK